MVSKVYGKYVVEVQTIGMAAVDGVIWNLDFLVIDQNFQKWE